MKQGERVVVGEDGSVGYLFWHGQLFSPAR